MKTLNNPSMDKIINLAKARGFVYAGSEIYGGLANSWDYGPLGIELKENIKNVWWKHFITSRLDMVGLDTGILMNPKVWEASGHVGGFSDPLIECKECNARHRADKLIEDFGTKKGEQIVADGWSSKKTTDFLKDNEIKCPSCGKLNWGEIKEFNLMFKTAQGVSEETATTVYLRPETAQGIFVNFANVLRTSRKKLPFGIGQVGKAFRNEITPGNFIFRTLEFEQMEIEYFVNPKEEKEWHKKWEAEMWSFLKDILAVNHPEKFKLRWHEEDELSHYSSGTFDIEYEFPFGWSELWGCASRTDFDLKQHEKFSGKELKYTDPQTNEKIVPYVIEPTFGLTRTLLMIMLDAYHEEELEDGTSRTVLKLDPKLSPIKVAVLPLVKKLSLEAAELFSMLAKEFACDFDEAGAIGKRYRRQDEIGTPFSVTVDFDTTGTGEDSNPKLKDTVTVRNRDTMDQERVKIEDLVEYIRKGISS